MVSPKVRPKDEAFVLWAVQARIPIPARLARRASERALGRYMAKALVESFGKIPPDFVAQSAAGLKKEACKSGLRLVGPDGREIGSAEGGKPFIM